MNALRIHLGWLTFVLAVAFVTCLLATLTFNAWLQVSDGRAIIAFFAFGIPTMIAGGATGRLWDGQQSLQTLLGWAGTTPWAAAANGDPIELPPATGKRDGSGTPCEKPIAAVGRSHS